MAGKAEIITNSAQLGLGLGLSLAKIDKVEITEINKKTANKNYSVLHSSV